MLIRESFSNGKKPGEVGDEGGLGNSDFNQGLKEAKFAFEILHLYKIRTPLPAPELKRKKSIIYFHHSDTHICQVHLRLLLYGMNRKYYFKFCLALLLGDGTLRRCRSIVTFDV